jgi:hypothetical protein
MAQTASKAQPTTSIVQRVMTDVATIPDFIKTGVRTGLENVGSESLPIPFLKLAQQGNPEAKAGPDKLPGCEPGTFFNQAIGHVYGAEMKIVVVGYEMVFEVWKGKYPDSQFQRILTATDFIENYKPKTKWSTEESTLLDAEGLAYNESHNFYVLPVDFPEHNVLLFSLKSTGIKVAKSFMARIRAIKIPGPDGLPSPIPIYQRVWELTSAFKNDKFGGHFEVGTVADLGWPTGRINSVAEVAFEEAQSYIDARVSGGEPKAELGEFKDQF